MAITYNNGVFRDNCEDLPPSSDWGSGQYTSKYIAFTAGTQNLSNPDPRASLTLSSDYARLGTKCYKLHLEKRTDKYNTGELQWLRNELAWMANGDLQAGNEWKFAAASILFHPSMDFGGEQRFQVLYDHKESPDDGNTKWWLGLRGDQFIVGGVHNGGESKLNITVKSVTWYDFILERTWGNNAYIKLYLNGKEVYSKTGNFFCNQSPFSRLQMGLYVWPWASQNGQNEGAGNAADAKPKTMYIDEIRFGNAKATLADFLLDGSAPPVVVDPPIVVDPPPVVVPPTTGIILINSGSTTDKFFTGGSTYKVTTPISGTTNDALYQDERFGNVKYAIPVANGNYTIKLHFAEIFHTAVNKRLFNVKIEGKEVITKLDIFREVGANTALEKLFPVTVTDGNINIEFITVLDNAAITGIEIMPGTIAPPVDTTIYYTSSVESTEAGHRSIVITWSDGSKTELYKKP